MKKKMLTCVVAVLTMGLAYGGDDICRERISLHSSTVPSDAADGKAELRIRDDLRTSFAVEVEDLLPDATYTVCVNGSSVGDISTSPITGRGQLDLDDQDEVDDGDADDVADPNDFFGGLTIQIVDGPCDSGVVRLGPTTSDIINLDCGP